MPITKQKKIEIVQSVKSKIDQTESLVFVNFHGLNVAMATNLRRSLKKNNVKYEVVKKSLLLRALGELNQKPAGAAPALDGEVAIAYLPAKTENDNLLPARNVYEFQSKINPSVGGGLKIIGGIFERQFKSAEEMIQLAMIPPREVLYGRFVNLLAWPLRGLVVALDQISKTKQQ
ncbi:MAG: 50S ribosomal protein L10 [Patescibacteria group bacterium]